MARMTSALPARADPRRARCRISTIRCARRTFRETRLRFRNDRWAARIGLDGLSDADWIGHFGRFEPLPGSFPSRWRCATTATSSGSTIPSSATAAAFSSPRPATSRDGRLLDLGTKGSGQTPWSRHGRRPADAEGRGARDPRHRDARGARGLHLEDLLADRDRRGARCAATSPRRRAPRCWCGSATATSASAASSACAALGETDALRRLVEHSIAHYWPDAAADARPGRRPLRPRRSGPSRRWAPNGSPPASCTASINSDNVNITGESFDYGPWRFLDRFDPGFTAAYFDQTGLYCFARQPEALNWNLARLGECLIPLSTRARDRAGVRELRRPVPGRARPARPSPVSASCPATTRRRRAR